MCLQKRIIMLCNQSYRKFQIIYWRQRWFHTSNKSSALAEIGDRLATIDMGRKEGGCCALFRGELAPSNTMSPGPRPTSTPSGILMHAAVWPQYMGQNGSKLGVLCPPFFWGGERGPHLTQCRLRWGLPPYQVACWPQQTWAENGGRSCAPFEEGELGPHLTQCGRGRGLLPFHLYPSNRLATIHQRHRQDRKIRQRRQTGQTTDR